MKELVENVASEDKEFKELPGMWHTCFHEPEWRLPFAHMLGWLETRAPQEAPAQVVASLDLLSVVPTSSD